MKSVGVRNVLFAVSMSIAGVIVWWVISYVMNTLWGPAPSIASLIMLFFFLVIHRKTERMGINPILNGELAVVPAFLVSATLAGVFVEGFGTKGSPVTFVTTRYVAPVVAAALLSALLGLLVKKAWDNRPFGIASTAVLAWLSIMGFFWLFHLVGLST